VPERQTVGRELTRAWEARFPRTGPKPEWARRLEPGHVRMWILRVVAAFDHARLADLPTRAALPGRAPDGHLLPKMTAAVPPELRQALRRRLADPLTWEIVAALGGIANERAGALRAAIDTLPPGERPPLEDKRLSEWACGIVVRPYRIEPALPEPAWLDIEQAAFLRGERERAARTAKLPTDAEFVTRYGPVYDRMWQDRGKAALAVLDPVELGLGRLQRPPMTADCNGWIVGTDQSVSQRYRYYLRARWSTDPAAGAEVAGLRLDDHIGHRLATAEPDAVCVGELDRVCSPIGLRFPQHHGLCASFIAGVEHADVVGAYEDRGGPGRPRPAALAEWAAAAPALSPAPDPALAAAVAACAVHWARYDARVAELVAGAAMFWPTQVRWAAARKLWNHLHHREVEWAAPLVRREVARLVRPLFTRHLNQLKGNAIPAPDEPLDGVPAPDPSPVHPDDPLLQASLAALGGDSRTPEMVALLAKGERGWETMYADLTRDRPQPCLPVPAFHAWALANLGHGTGEE